MRLTAAHYDIGLLEPTVLLHEDDCRVLGLVEGDRVRVDGRRGTVAIVSMSDTLVDRGTVMMTPTVLAASRSEEGDLVDVQPSPQPDSVRAIRRKMDGATLGAEEVRQVVDDVVNDRLSRIEASAWVTALHIRGMTADETAEYAMAMADSGGRVDFGDRRVFDFHSFGGVPGNKITPIVVSIAAAEGLTVPKLSSRAISSACGTADFVEVLCPVDLDTESVRRVSEEVGGVFSWTGATDLAPAGDHLIRVQRPLGIDPRSQMLASILAKKAAVGATDLLMDIPTGPGTKVHTLAEAESYVRELTALGERMGIDVECVVTAADRPLGHAIGPALEARECVMTLEDPASHREVADKACLCAGALLSMAGYPDGRRRAEEALASGAARRRFIEIVRAQGGGDPRSSDILPGGYSADIVAEGPGTVTGILNRAVVAVAKAAGAPRDKGAGVMLVADVGDEVSAGDVLMTVHAEAGCKLEDAVGKAREACPYVIGRVRLPFRTWVRYKYSILFEATSQLGE